LAIVTFLTLPVALAGGALAALIGGGDITLGTLAGCIAVLTLAVRFNVNLVKRFQFLERQQDESFGSDLVVRGTRERIAPIVMTTLAVAAVMAPFLFTSGAPGSEIVRPMAIVVLGGLVTTTLLSVVVLPAVYLRFGFVAEPDTSAEDLVVAIPDVDAVSG
jgi:Cu/Ag efflux pump CusA